MALLSKGTGIFEAFNDPLGVEHFYAQERRNVAAEEQIESENAQWNAKVNAQIEADKWEAVHIDPRMLDKDEHSTVIAEREGKTWYEFQLRCLGLTASQKHAKLAESVEFAERLGFSPADVWVREPVGPPQSYLEIGIARGRRRIRQSV